MKKIYILIVTLACTFNLLRGNDSTVVNSCQADFWYSYDMGIMCFLPCSPVQFYDYSWGNAEAVSWSWDFGDGNYSDEQNPLHIYTFLSNENGTTGPSEITVCLKVFFADSCISEICQTVPLSPEPEKCFVYFWPYRNDSLVSIPEAVPYSFDVQVPVNTLSWHWDFGDGTTSDEPSPVHGYYFQGGVYTVCLTIQTDDSCIQTYCTDLYVGPEDTSIVPDCQAYYTYYNFNSDPLKYAFSDQSSGDAVEWFWDFGDGSYSKEPNPVHAFKGKPWFDSLPPGIPEPYGGIYYDSINADNSDPSTGVYYDSIDLGDFYPQDFAYMVCLTISTPSGCSSTYCEYVAVPYYDTIIRPDLCTYMIRLNTSNILGISCSGTATASLYDFFDGQDVPASVYWSTGSYGDFVSGLCANMPYYVILTSPEGCTVAGSFAVMDYSVPVYTFGYWSYSGIGNDYRFAYNTPDSSYQCYWDFGNGVIMEGDEVDYTVTEGMENNVNLTVYDANGNLVHSEQIKVSFEPTGLTEPALTSARIYPNPVSDLLFLELGENNYELIDFMVFDMTGKMVLARQMAGNNNEPYSVDVSDLPRGIFLARIMHGNKLIASEKFMK